jgi:hypothetical protein
MLEKLFGYFLQEWGVISQTPMLLALYSVTSGLAGWNIAKVLYKTQRENLLSRMEAVEAREKFHKDRAEVLESAKHDIENRIVANPTPEPAIEPASPTTVSALSGRAYGLAQELLGFLQEGGGPPPESPINHLRSKDEVFEAVRAAWEPYLVRVHNGYLRRFKQRVNDVHLELAENGINDAEIERLINRPNHTIAMTDERVRQIANYLIEAVQDLNMKDASNCRH